MIRNESTQIREVIALAIVAFAFGACAAGNGDGPGNLLSGLACDRFTIGSDPNCVCCSNSAEGCVIESSPCAPEARSAECGNRCPAGFACVTVNGKSVCGTKSRCDGPSEQACGNCGTQTRHCNDGTWSSWSECRGGECPAGATETCAGGVRQCSASCSWGPCVECLEGQFDSSSCGTCRAQTRSCQDAKWGSWSECESFGECTPGEVRACTDGEQRCGEGCWWNDCVAYECVAPAVSSEPCGKCGTRTRTCREDHTWSEFSACSGEGECNPGAVEACGRYRHYCSDLCRWGDCAPECEAGAVDQQACGNCGTQSRTCRDGLWDEFGSCTGEGECEAGTVRACGKEGTQSCSDACEWDPCLGQKCDGDPVRLCGNCGFQSRSCNNGVWNGWSTCTAERDCVPGQLRACENGASQGCGLDCYWEPCQ